MRSQFPQSAGLLLFRRKPNVEVFVAHPGGPFWESRDEGAWTLPKGEIQSMEEPLDAAIREFQEETGILPHGPYKSLGWVQQRAGKIVHAWAWEGDADPRRIQSNLMRVQWPKGRWISVPEIDRCEWFDPETAKRKLNVAQAAFVDRLLQWLDDPSDCP